MAKGAIIKKEIMQKIIEVFPGSFLYNNGKEIRINEVEEGNPVQIKITLTCAKTPVENEDETMIQVPSNTITFVENPSFNKTDIIEPTEEEKANLKTLLDNLDAPWSD